MKRKILALIVILITIQAIFMVSSQAVTQSLTLNKTTAKPGDAVELSVGITGVSEVSGGVNSFVATIVYDKAVFNEIKSADITGQNGWGGASFNATTGQVTLDNASMITNDGVVLKLKLTLKSSLTAPSASIEVKGLNVSNGSGNSAAESSKVQLTIGSSDAVGLPTSKTTTKATATAKSTVLPQTGIDEITPFVVVGGTIAILVVLVVVLRKRFEFK